MGEYWCFGFLLNDSKANNCTLGARVMAPLGHLDSAVALQ